MQNEKKFGDFIAERRYAKGITVRRMAEMIGISPSHYNDMERRRRNPPDSDILNRLIDALGLFGEDKLEFFDLVGRARSAVSPDLPEYIMSNDEVRVALRIAKEKATPEDWQRFIKQLENK